MKKFSANYIFPGNAAPIKNGVVVVDDDGVVMELLDPAVDEVGYDEVEVHEGIICPGFVNTHCHLELSHLKGKVGEQTQLHGFVKEVMSIREDFTDEQRKQAVVKAVQEMKANGIVAVGDISNGATSFETKKQGQLKYYTFVEVFGLDGAEAKSIMDRAQQLMAANQNSKCSITPHASYSLSNELIELVNQQGTQILSIHNQETASENELFQSGSGALYEQLANFSESIKHWQPTGKSALQSYLDHYKQTERLQLVHNTFTSAEDVAFARNSSTTIYWCFCPNANQYIEGRQPNYQLFLEEKCTIGTDSLASNWSLSILDELKTITQTDPTISLETLIKWATWNGAEYLGFHQLGSIEEGKQPGLNLIKNVNLESLRLTKCSSVNPL